jgi:hypothetical protein
VLVVVPQLVQSGERCIGRVDRVRHERLRRAQSVRMVICDAAQHTASRRSPLRLAFADRESW